MGGSGFDALLPVLLGLILRHTYVVLQSTKGPGSSCLIDYLLLTSPFLMVLFFSRTAITLTQRAVSDLDSTLRFTQSRMPT